MCSIDIIELNHWLNEAQNNVDVTTVKNDEPIVHSNTETLVRPRPSWVLHCAAGAISGPVSRTLTAPLDRLRLQIQVAQEKQTLLQAWRSLMRNGGIFGLWRGNGINVVKVAPEMAIRFGVFDRVKEFFTGPAEDGVKLSMTQRFISGAIAGVLGQLAIYPMETLKIRMMVRKRGEYRNVFHAVYKIYKNEGMRVFYRGYTSSATGTVPYIGVDLTMYETLKNYFIYSRLEKGEEPPTWKLLLCASVSISVGQCSSYPFYLVKARQQARSDHQSVKSYKGICELCHVLLAILKHDGITGLYRGMMLTLLKVLPAGVINYVVYEHARRHLAPYIE